MSGHFLSIVCNRRRHQILLLSSDRGKVPPSILSSVPVMEAARGEARKATTPATSLGRAERPIEMPPSYSSERSTQPDDDEFIIVRLPGTKMAAEAEGEIVIIQNSDMPSIQDYHIFDCDKRKGK
jgi:hypothetical protein